MKVYYNEIDDYCVQVLYESMKDGIIPEGDMDTRSIEDVRPLDIIEYDQCHFFAGIGVWAYVTKEMGRLWTGSCPCQPFSRAGKGKGFADQRHLWPAFHWLIEQCRPPVVLGEQVGGKAAFPWLDLVQDDLEGSGYAFGRKISRLVASVRRTSDSEFTGAGYTTTTTRDWKDTGTIRNRKDGRTRVDQLPRQVAIVGYPTTTSTDGSRGVGTIRPQDTGKPLPQVVSGVMSNGSLIKTESGDRLNPELSLWLMGLPGEYLSCLLSAIPSWLHRRKSLRKR